MELKKLALKNTLLKIRVGSHLYGINTPESDEDFAGIFVPSIEYLLGFRRVEQVDLGVKAKDEAGKNTKEAVDCVLYTLAKFTSLALQNNPNILEMLFVNPENVLFISDVGRELLDLRYQFLSRKIKNRFLGYAFSQKHKMVIKLENYENLLEAVEYIDHNTDKQFLLDIEHHPLFVRKKDHVAVGDINMPVTITTKRAKKLLGDRLAKFGNRKELVTKYGYDVKFASNLIRLLSEGVELLSTGDLKFPLQCGDLLRNIRAGKFSMQEVLEMAEDIERNVENLHETTKLLNKPNERLIEEFVIRTHKNYILGD